MRWCLLLFVVAVASNCNWPTGTTGGAAGGTGGSSGGSCSQTAGCPACSTCALGGPCKSLYDACMANSSCSAIDQCAQGCGGLTNKSCVTDNCIPPNPDGVSDWTAVTNCLNCQQCPTACAGLCN
jgi:hypothetical protein